MISNSTADTGWGCLLFITIIIIKISLIGNLLSYFVSPQQPQTCRKITVCLRCVIGDDCGIVLCLELTDNLKL